MPKQFPTTTIESAKSMFNNGVSISAISKELGVSYPTVKRWVSEQSVKPSSKSSKKNVATKQPKKAKRAKTVVEPVIEESPLNSLTTVEAIREYLDAKVKDANNELATIKESTQSLIETAVEKIAVLADEKRKKDMQEIWDADVKTVKELRVELDGSLQKLKKYADESLNEECEVSILKIKEAIMWLGMELKALGAQNPYPNSYNPDSTEIEHTADGMKM